MARRRACAGRTGLQRFLYRGSGLGGGGIRGAVVRAGGRRARRCRSRDGHRGARPVRAGRIVWQRPRRARPPAGEDRRVGAAGRTSHARSAGRGGRRALPRGDRARGVRQRRRRAKPQRR